ncbi:folate-binding protein YgfZ [Reinekea sp. G2M2-21]|uniref:CAF17-like 4Fe-4S cluster assembly/insertion protein YgfZ n=1 Tax=Reinekea sp. G2M2-21 TaxID=2788942 RepID=UPI0018A90AA7|nr:folate-binding protein YgfZ [Reinekea sp. G2M2-21]
MNQLSRYPLVHLDVIRLEGQDSLKFLQGQCTQDVSRVDAHHPMQGAFCNAKGRTITNVWIVQNAKQSHIYYLLCERTSAPVLFRHLTKYVAFFRGAKMTYEDGQYIGYGLSGTGLNACKESLANELAEGFFCDWGQHRGMFWQPAQTTCPTEIAQAEPGAVDVWQVEDIKERFIWLNEQQVEQWIPQNFSLDELNGISFSKGCYTGQEVVARLHYKGQSKKRLFTVTWSSDEQIEQVFSEQGIIGDVIQQATVAGNGFGLAIIITEQTEFPMFADENQQVAVQLLH